MHVQRVRHFCHTRQDNIMVWIGRSFPDQWKNAEFCKVACLQCEPWWGDPWLSSWLLEENVWLEVVWPTDSGYRHHRGLPSLDCLVSGCPVPDKKSQYGHSFQSICRTPNTQPFPFFPFHFFSFLSLFYLSSLHAVDQASARSFLVQCRRFHSNCFLITLKQSWCPRYVLRNYIITPLIQ